MPSTRTLCSFERFADCGAFQEEVTRLLLQEAASIISNDVALIPLYFQVSAWATKKGITYTGRGDERTYAYNFKPK